MLQKTTAKRSLCAAQLLTMRRPAANHSAIIVKAKVAAPANKL